MQEEINDCFQKLPGDFVGIEDMQLKHSDLNSSHRISTEVCRENVSKNHC